MTMTKGLLAAAAAMTAMIAATSADAAVTIKIAQVGADVVVSASGTFETREASVIQRSRAQIAIYPSLNYVVFGSTELLTQYRMTGSAAFNSGNTATFFDVYDGDGVGFWVQANSFFLADDYVNNSQISATGKVFGKTIAGIGLKTGTYEYRVGSNQLTVNIGQPVTGAVPEPASWALMIAGVGMAGGALRRRRTARTAVTFA